MVLSDQSRYADFDKRNWALALDKFLASRKESEKRTIDEFLKGGSTIESVRDTCRSTREKVQNEYSPALGGILEKIEVAMRTGDAVMQSAPDTVGLAWMGVRLCFHVISDDHATSTLFINVCSDILGILISCRVYGQMYSAERGPKGFRELHSQVLDLIPDIYADILEFSYAMKKHIDKRKSIRILKTALNSYSYKFEMLAKQLRDDEAKMRDFATQASQRLSLYYHEAGQAGQEAMMERLSKIDQSLASTLDMNQRLAETLYRTDEGRRSLKRTPLELAKEQLESNMNKLSANSDQHGVLEAKKRLREPGTCLWIFDQANWDQWGQTGSANLLWLTGSAGFGKSVLTSTVVEHLSSRSQDVDPESVVLFYFCSMSDDATKSTVEVQAHLLHQLCNHLDESLDTLRSVNDTLSAYLEQTVKSKVTFADAFTALAKSSGKRINLIVDAIDECIDRRERNLLPALKAIAERMDSHIRIFMSSRPESDIATSMEHALQIKVEGNNEKDIRTNTKSLLSKMQGWTARERHLAEDEIVRKAGGFFRYVELAMDFLRQPWKRPLSKRLEQLPVGIDASYQQILTNVDPNYRGLLRTALLYLVLGQGEVRCSEIADAYSGLYAADNLESGDSSDSESEPSEGTLQEDPIDQIVEQLRFAGSSLIDVNSSTGVLGLRHLTVSEYLLKQPLQPEVSEDLCANCGALRDEVAPIHISEKDGHLEIAMTILRHLLAFPFQVRYLSHARDLLRQSDQSSSEDAMPEDAMPEEDLKSGNRFVDGSEQKPDPGPMSPTMPEIKCSPSDAGSEDAIEKNPTRNGGTHVGSNSFVGDAPSASIDDEEKKTPTSKSYGSEDGWSVGMESEDDEDLEVESDLDEMAVHFEWPDSKSTATRYEVEALPFHLRMLERLWPQEERVGPKWVEFWDLIDQFFGSDLTAFHLWLISYCWSPTGIKQFGHDHKGATTRDTRLMPVHVIATFGLASICDQLASTGKLGDVNSEVLDRMRPLHYATAVVGSEPVREKLEIIRRFLDHGAEINATCDLDGTTPLFLLLERDPPADIVRFMLDRGANARHLDSDGWCSLHYHAISYGEADIISILIEHGADVNHQDNVDHQTPLFLLLSSYRPPDKRQNCVRKLLAHGAQCNVEDQDSRRPLAEAAQFGNHEVLQMLIDAGADIQAVDDEGWNALHRAIRFAPEERCLDTIRILVDAGIDLAAVPNPGYTTFMLAVVNCDVDIATYILSASEPSVPDTAVRADKQGRTPLATAAARNSLDTMRFLLSRSDVLSAIDMPDNIFRKTPLHLAAQNAYPESVKLLLQHGASPTATERLGRTPLYLCFHSWRSQVQERFEETAKILLEVSHVSPSDATGLLKLAAAQGGTQILEKLVALEGDPSHREEDGWTAIDIARQHGREEEVKFLSSSRFRGYRRPTGFIATRYKHIRISEDGLELSNQEPSGGLGWTFISNHPIPPTAEKYYFEISVLEANEIEHSQLCTIGVCHKLLKTSSWLPGLKYKRAPSTYSWGYHGNGWIHVLCPESVLYYDNPCETFGPGDTVGCGLDLTSGRGFFTKNGRRLMDVAFNRVHGRVFAAVGLGARTRARANLGASPFVWAPGNSDDFEVPMYPARKKS